MDNIQSDSSTLKPTSEGVPLSSLVRNEYRNYQIYTLMDRAIPYLEDGLKPCQRRILYTLWKHSSKGLMKVSSATGLVLTLHPHGPASIESSVVNMAQDFIFANNYPLIDKKGYFGERMEQEPAASRYIECKIGEVAALLLFDDIDQVVMVPNYDEKMEEPLSLLPKLPLMLLNGAEGIGTGFSSVIPPFNHKDIIDSMISIINTGRPKKLRAWFRNYKKDFKVDGNGRIVTEINYEEIDEKIFITELPRGYDSARIYKHLGRYIEKDYLKDYIDSSVDNQINIELIFKKGQRPALSEVKEKMAAYTALTPNYTLISARGVKIFNNPEDILKIFTEQRIVVVKRRYQLLVENAVESIKKNKEIIRFVEEKHYSVAHKSANRQTFISYLQSKNFCFCEYLSEMPVYRLTQEEVKKREEMVREDQKKLKEFKSILSSDILIREKLIDELKLVNDKLNIICSNRDKERKRIFSKKEKK